jgi:hypothetical protein
VFSATLLALAGVSIGVVTASAQGNEDNITICHRSNAVGNEYQEITVDASAVDGVGGGDHFGEHQGPLVTSSAEAQALKDQMIMWGDIIPPLEGVHGGLNWPQGQAILENNCEFVTPPTTTAPPRTAPPTTAPPTTAPPRTAPPTQPPREAAPTAPGAPAAPRAPGAPAAAPGAAAPGAPSAAAVPAQPRGVTG